MKTVLDNFYELIIKKSKFLVFTYNVNSIEQINEKLETLRKEYNDATHICYAYILNNIAKYSDDGEPNGTAGAPILNVLQKEDLNNVLTVIIRYFGGIKLGASGLVRAYSNACKNSLIVTNLIKGYKVKITFKYELIKQIDYILKNSKIINKEFNEQTTYIVLVKEDEINALNKISNIEILEDIYI